MHVLLLRPIPGNERFGLGPFFRIEPLGMEYIAAALEGRGHRVTIADLRFSGSVEQQLRRTRPDLVGIAGMHALETDKVLGLAREIRRLAPGVPIVIGGHTAAAYPEPFLSGPVDAVVLDDGERALPEIVDAIEKRRPLSEVPGIAVGDQSGGVRRTEANPDAFDLDDVPLPSRRLVDGWRRQYACLAHRPTWLIETARGCPFRCSFCSIWQLHARSVRERSIESVCQDFAGCGDEIFVADDLFCTTRREAAPRHGAAAPRDPQEADPGPEPGRSRARHADLLRPGGRSRVTSTSFGPKPPPTRA
jgi:radical SAM superfamily enzyme YgiQ (UPF0313 family)